MCWPLWDGRCCAIGSSCWLVLSCGWSFVVLIFIVMDCEMGNCFSISKGKTTAFSVEWPFWLCTWTTDKKNTIKYSTGKHSELDSSLCHSSSVPDQFNWTKMELYHPYYLKERSLILPLTRMLICRGWTLLILCGERIIIHGNIECEEKLGLEYWGGRYISCGMYITYTTWCILTWLFYEECSEQLD